MEAQQRGSVAAVAMKARASRNADCKKKGSNPYPIGLKVTDNELAALNLLFDPFHGEWNYAIKPQLQ